jgi:hypothetical protein
MDLVEASMDTFAETAIAARRTIGVEKQRRTVEMVARQVLDIVAHPVIVIMDIYMNLALVDIQMAGKERKVGVGGVIRVAMKMVAKEIVKVTIREVMKVVIKVVTEGIMKAATKDVMNVVTKEIMKVTTMEAM